MKQQTWPEAPLTVLTSVLELASSPTRFGRTHVCRQVSLAWAGGIARRTERTAQADCAPDTQCHARLSAWWVCRRMQQRKSRKTR